MSLNGSMGSGTTPRLVHGFPDSSGTDLVAVVGAAPAPHIQAVRHVDEVASTACVDLGLVPGPHIASEEANLSVDVNEVCGVVNGVVLGSLGSSVCDVLQEHKLGEDAASFASVPVGGRVPVVSQEPVARVEGDDVSLVDTLCVQDASPAGLAGGHGGHDSGRGQGTTETGAVITSPDKAEIDDIVAQEETVSGGC
jgi:hypothetical protein